MQDSYDASGNLLQEPFLPGISDTYTYGADGIMTSSNGTTYTYDGLGQRVRKDSSGGAKEYFYFGGTLLSTRDAATGAWTDNIYGGGRLLATVAGTETATPVWRMGDHLDSLAYQADNQGNLLSTTSMTPFGQTLADGSGSSYLFTGLERDSENNTDHTPNRQYNSRQGRWLSPDPYLRSIDLTNPQSLNRYSYVLNNPLRFVDPSGLDCVTAGFTKEGLPVITINQGDCPGKDPNNEYYMDCDSRGGDGCLMGSTSAQTNGDGNLVLFDSNGHEMGQVGADSTGGFGYTGSQSQSDGFPTIFALQSDTGSSGSGGTSASSDTSNDPQPSQLDKYRDFLACYYNSTIEQITNEEDGQSPSYFGVIDSLALVALKGGLGPWGIVPVAGAALSHIGVGVKANTECTNSVYGK